MIQTCAKSKLGCGKFLYVHYFAPMNEEKPSAEIIYDVEYYASDRELIFS